VIWLDKLQGVKGNPYTGTDVAVYLDWYSWLRQVADLAGVSLGNAESWYNDAVSKAGAGDLDGAYASARYAVRLARDLLLAQVDKLEAEFDARRQNLVSQLSQAKAQGVDVSAFYKYLSQVDLLRRAGGRELCPALYLIDSLTSSLATYVQRWQAGAMNLDPGSGVFDVPAGTTDVIIFNQLLGEGAGYGAVWANSDVFKGWIASTIKDYCPEANILEVRYSPPLIIVFIQSPIAWGAALAAIWAIIKTTLPFAIKCIAATIVVYAVGKYVVQPICRVFEKRAEAEKTIAEAQEHTVTSIVNSPDLSEETKKDMVENVTKSYSSIAESAAAGPSLSDIMKLMVVMVGCIGAVAVLSSLIKK